MTLAYFFATGCRERDRQAELQKRRDLIYEIQAMEARSNALAKKPKEVANSFQYEMKISRKRVR